MAAVREQEEEVERVNKTIKAKEFNKREIRRVGGREGSGENMSTEMREKRKIKEKKQKIYKEKKKGIGETR